MHLVQVLYYSLTIHVQTIQITSPAGRLARKPGDSTNSINKQTQKTIQHNKIQKTNKPKTKCRKTFIKIIIKIYPIAEGPGARIFSNSSFSVKKWLISTKLSFNCRYQKPNSLVNRIKLFYFTL